ncbi:hypothetical protein ACFPU0_13245 [Pseudomonas sp. GCM10022186]|uniref:hypothetical protein n=1 Tax=Pseudomonas sp. GCM10022186 TaxID=3252650 RepID=UPI00361EF1AA
MANYFVVNTASNLIIDVVATSYSPQDNKIKKFVKANEKALTLYYKWLDHNPDALMDIGDLMARSDYINDQVVDGKAAKVKPQRLSYRDKQTEAPVENRAAIIAAWIADNPSKDAYELNDVFACGMTAARAYIQEYRKFD